MAEWKEAREEGEGGGGGDERRGKREGGGNLWEEEGSVQMEKGGERGGKARATACESTLLFASRLAPFLTRNSATSRWPK